MANYSMPIGVHGTKLVIGGSNGKFDVGAELAALKIRGRITTGDIAVTHFFIKSRFQNLLGEFGFSAKHNTLTVLDNLIGDDDIRALKLGVNWDRLDLSGRWYVSVFGFQGLGPILGGMSDNSAQSTRQGADNSFTKATFATGRIQSLGHNVLLVVKGSGQITTGPVVVIEQTLLGGPDSVRGYQLGERFVDEGYTLSAETRHSVVPVLDADRAERDARRHLHRLRRRPSAQSITWRATLHQPDRYRGGPADAIAVVQQQCAIRPGVPHRPNTEWRHDRGRPVSDILISRS